MVLSRPALALAGLASLATLAAGCVPGARKELDLDLELAAVPRTLETAAGPVELQLLELTLGDLWLREALGDPLPEPLPGEVVEARAGAGPILAGGPGPHRFLPLGEAELVPEALHGREGQAASVDLALVGELALSLSLMLESGEAVAVRLAGPVPAWDLPADLSLEAPGFGESAPVLRVQLDLAPAAGAAAAAPEGARSEAAAAALSLAESWSVELAP